MPYQCDPCQCPEQHYRDSMSWRKAMITLLCRISDYLSGALDPPIDALFEPAVDLTAADIGTGYVLGTNLPDDTRSFTLVNQMDGDVVVSFDNTNDHYFLTSAQSINVNLFEIGRVTTTNIYVKDGVQVPTDGHFYIYSMR